MQHSVFYGTKSTPNETCHVREYDFQNFKPQPQWIVRTPEEVKVYERLRGLKVSDTLACDSFASSNSGEKAYKKTLAQIDEPSLMWPGYKLKARNLRYETTSQAAYGRFLPTVHEMPDSHHGLGQKFSSSLLASEYQGRRSPLTHQDVITWTSYCTVTFGLALIVLSVYSLAMYPELRQIWHPAVGLAVLLLLTGLFDVLASHGHQGLPFLRQNQNCLAVSFLGFGCLCTVYSAGVIVGSAVFFPAVLDDRTDHLQSLKTTMMTSFIMAFAFAVVQTAVSLRFVYAQFFDEFLDDSSNAIDMSPLVVKTSPFLNLQLEERKGVPAAGPRTVVKQQQQPPSDVRTYLCRNDAESEEEFTEKNETAVGVSNVPVAGEMAV
ncbi:hypothetical protein BV898_06662 [Hypsibius exemplaris]|uniref:Uncharacterized protein n=1 Tax=Hypsibius exemplaris TaxID=2072580 RepID=A0A1W0WVJ8_HYPEX|nr:hypothetical protein BV898_06662 [Hypsibius exemplaris]